ncbi:MAG TPA: PDZ domain-containing protein, partial [Planctomycetota bacterium]|nr:PDZ domain-containing protein [Planctomycetota bacterium]
VSATHVAFAYADGLWVVPREGGVASPVSSPPGPEVFPRFSADGQTLLFSGNYDGGRDLFTVPVAGGVPTRLTHHPLPEQVCDWTPDGQVLFSSAHQSLLGGRAVQLFTVGPQGGLPGKLPVPYGGNGAISEDGQWLAYVPIPFDSRTWKRYEGGTAMDIWLFNLTTHESRRMTDWQGSDTYPMWRGQIVYYLSDAGSNHQLNLWAYDIDSGDRVQVTDFADFDVRWPAIGPGPDGGGEIVFQHGSDLHLLDLASGATRELEVTIPGDRPFIAPQSHDVAKAALNWGLSPGGKRAVVEARGDIWTLPAEHGAPRNLTATDDVTERSPAWSPDGEWIAYVSDAGGEYELYLTRSDGAGRGEAARPRQLTDGHTAFFMGPTWAPDSKRLAFQDQTGRLYVHHLEPNRTDEVDRDPFAGTATLSWSHDGSWLAYTKTGDNLLRSVWLHDAVAGGIQPLTAGVFNDSWPCFDREGKYLFFASAREFSEPRYEDLGTTFVYSATDRLYAVPLRADVPSPFLPESDEELWGEAKAKAEKEAAAKGKDGDGKDKQGEDQPGDSAPEGAAKPEEAQGDAAKPADAKAEADEPKERLKIDTEGFERRAVRLPVERGNFTHLSLTDDHKLVYVRRKPNGVEGPASVHVFDLKDDKREEKTLADKADQAALSADGKVLLVVHEGAATLRESKPGSEAKPVVTAGMRVTVDPRAEWREMYADAWRRFRDWFYDPHMHGVDWPAMRERYAAMLDDCASRNDLGYVIRELISELNVGHAYYQPSELEGDLNPAVPVGLLGCEFELEQGAYRIKAIYEGGPWDADARGPLSQPGVDAKAGDFLLAVDGVPLDPAVDPWAPFVGKADRVVTLTLSDKAVLDDSARSVLVQPVASDADLRYRAWVELNRQYVERATGGKVGYIHVPDTGINGQNNLFRQFYGQVHKPALIIDERWNGGGQVPTRFIELLARPATNYWAIRDSQPLVWPPDSHQGPKCMLINQRAGSGGDAFPYYFRQAGLGPLIGVRTWGGLIGIGDLPDLLDGADVSVPNFAFYELDGTWGVEGYGVAPDVEVIDDPALMVDGGEPQLDKAIELMLEALREGRGHEVKPVPPYPDRSGMGLRPEDR